MHNKHDVTLRWCYSSGQDYEFHSADAAQIGQLYRLKVLEPAVQSVEVIFGGRVIISWKRQDE
jgi:hypothetical protein